MKHHQQTIHVAIVVLLGITVFIFVKAPSPEKQRLDYEASTKSLVINKARNQHPISSKVRSDEKVTKAVEMPLSPSKRLIRFGELKDRVLLNVEETMERERLMSDQKIVEWISSNLTKASVARDLKDRFSMIDFLEDAVTWKDNPNRENVLRTILDVVLSETYLMASRDSKRQFVGDKIELFAILSEQASEEAESLRSKAQGTKLESILDYATKRLPVKQIKVGGQK